MPFCPSCGTGNPDGARFCQSCGTAIPAAAPPPAGGPAPLGGQVPPVYGAPGHAPPPGYGAPARPKSPGAAAALGLLWGLGAQAFYNGQPMKAVAQIVLNLLIIWPMVQAAGSGALILGLAIASIFMFDGYKVAQKINAGVPVGRWTFF